MGRLFDTLEKLQAGMTEKELLAQDRKASKQRAKEEGKSFGECESCGEETCLVEEVGLCGPCCFGESATYNGNW